MNCKRSAKKFQRIVQGLQNILPFLSSSDFLLVKPHLFLRMQKLQFRRKLGNLPHWNKSTLLRSAVSHVKGNLPHWNKSTLLRSAVSHVKGKIRPTRNTYKCLQNFLNIRMFKLSCSRVDWFKKMFHGFYKPNLRT